MLILKIIGSFVLLISVFVLFKLLNKHAQDKYSYRFLNTPVFWSIVTAMALILIGNLWREDALQTGNDALNGIVVMSIGVLIVLFIVYINFKRTNFWYGVGGTALQAIAFGIPTFFGYPFLIFCIVLWLFSGTGETRYIRVYKRS